MATFSENIQEAMSGKTDQELFGILHAHPEDFTPDAIQAAREEFGRRGPTPQEMGSFAVVADKERETREAGLGWGLRATAFFVPPVFFFIPTLLVHRHFTEKGERRKAHEWLRWAIYGFAFDCGVGLLVRLFG